MERVVGQLARQDRAVLQAGAHRVHLVDGEGRRARGGGGRADDPQGHPHDAERRGGSQHHAAVAGRGPRHAQQREDGDDEEAEDEHGDDDDGDIGAVRPIASPSVSMPMPT